MASIELTDIRKSFGNVHVIHGVDLDIKKGEFIVFVGPSGCGKSTLLRLIAGLEDITAGTLKIDGRVVNQAPPSERGIAMVFQSYALYPHMTVYENMAFGLKLQGEKANVEKRVNDVARILQIDQYLERLPKQLSGGQRQRVAIGRAIVRDPKVFLFDEPLSNLDAALRVQTRIEIAKLHEEMTGTTMIYVTHDQVEAMTLADRIVVLNGGRIEQVGSPMELYRDPANLFVAQFIGSPAMNVVPCAISESGGAVSATPAGGKTFAFPAIPSAGGATSGSFGVRPEDLGLADASTGVFEGLVDIVEKLGEVQLLYVNLADDGGQIVAKVDGNLEIEKGQTVALSVEPGRAHLFDGNGRAIRPAAMNAAA